MENWTFSFVVPLISCCCSVQHILCTTDTSNCVMPQTQENAYSLGEGSWAILGWIHYVELAFSSMNSLGPFAASGISQKVSFTLSVTKKYTFEMAVKCCHKGVSQSAITLFCAKTRAVFQTELCVPAVFVRRKQERQKLTSEWQISSPKWTCNAVQKDPKFTNAGKFCVFVF